MVCLVSRASSGTTFYVRVGGSDSANGTSPQTAFATIGHAADSISTWGDQVIVGPGTYTEGNINPGHTGIPGHPVEFVADTTGVSTGDVAGAVVIMPPMPPDPQTTGFLILGLHDIVIDGFTIVGAFDAAIQVRSAADGSMNSSNVTIRNTEVRNGVKRGIDVAAAGSIVVENSNAVGNGTGGITVAGCGSPSPLCRVGQPEFVTPTVSGNTSAMNGAEGISVVDAVGGSIEQNELSGNMGSGMLVESSSGLSITGNMAADSGNDGIGIGTGFQPGTTPSDIDLTGNVVTGSAKAGMNIVVTGSLTVEQNSVGVSGTAGVAVTGDTIQIDLSNNQVTGGVSVAGAAGGVIADNVIQDSNADGLAVQDSSELSLLDNVVSRSNGNGIVIGTNGVAAGQNFLLEGNQVTASTTGGIRVLASGAVQAIQNTVTHSGSVGLSIESGAAPITATVVNNTLGTSGSHGLFVAGLSSGLVQNNRSFSNGDTGITARSAANTSLVNNLVYANASDGLAIGTGTGADGSPSAVVINNTSYQNSGWGLVIGNATSASPNGVVLDNILEHNTMGGIAVAGSSTCEYVAGFNINVDGYGPDTPQNAYDIVADPLLLNPAGPDGVLGGDAYADDNFRLRQQRGGQPTNSPAVDAGVASVAAVGLGGSTANGNVPDVGTIDIGYHYGTTADQRITVPTPYMPFFVRQGGNDNNDGLDPRRALASIQEGARRSRAGATVVVGPGRYAEGDIHPVQNAGPVTFFADATGIQTGDLPGVVLVDAGGKDTAFVLLSACSVVIDGFHVTGSQQAGIQVRSGANGAHIRNNIAFSNASRGIEILGADDGELSNNLVYANGTGGIQVQQGANSVVVNNTVYANGLSGAGDGILVGGSTDAYAAPGATVLRNVVAANGKGIKVQTNSFGGYVTGYNVAWGPDAFAANTPQADSDYIGDPLLVNPAGPDGVLGGAQFLDDDFHLVQDDVALSPAVDVDFAEANLLADGSTQADGLPDLGPLDAGYHYPFLPRTPMGRAVETVVYVRGNGNDANSGSVPELAFASVSKALASMTGQGLVVIGPGHYSVNGLVLGGAGGGGTPPILFGDATGALTGDAEGPVVIDSTGGHAPIVIGATVIDGLTFTGARGPAMRVMQGAHGVTIRNTVFCGNASGPFTSGDGVDLTNNLVCSNRGVGVDVRLRSARQLTRILNTTVVANGRQGIVIREQGATTSHVSMYNNVVAGNGSTGITARAIRGNRPLSGSNLNTDGYASGTLPGPGDVTVNPQFVGVVQGPAAGCAASGNLRVAPTSPAINAGIGTAIEMGLGQRSVTSTGLVDSGPVDLGFHYE